MEQINWIIWMSGLDCIETFRAYKLEYLNIK